jgi:acyl carrier protein
MDVEAALRESISRICVIDVSGVTRDTTLDDLGIDSLASAEIITDVEIRLGHDLPVDVFRRLAVAKTVGDVANVIEHAYDPSGATPDAGDAAL